MSLIEIHSRLANTAMFYIIIMAAWGFWRYFRRQGVDSSYWGALVIAEVLLVLQAALGVYLWLSGTGQLGGHSIHILYGVISVLVIPGAYLYTHGGEERRALLIYGGGLIFLIGIVLRAISTGAGNP